MGKDGEVAGTKREFKRKVRSRYLDSDDSDWDEDFVLENEEIFDSEEEEDGDDDVVNSEESFQGLVEGGAEEEVFRNTSRSKRGWGSDENAGGRISRKKNIVSCVDVDFEEGQDEEYMNGVDDEEFTPEEEDDFLEEKNSNVKVSKRNTQKSSSTKGKRRKKSRVSKKPSMLRTRRLRKKEGSDRHYEDDADLLDSIPIRRKKSRSKKTSQSCKRRLYVADSDSDFICSGSSDFDVRILANCDVSWQKHSVSKKGKEKAKEIKAKVGKKVCGICLSEEDKRRSRGTLNCCSHYFCFACVMEWSKVESRCPLCKQRFKTITKHGRSTMGVDLRNVVIEVPKRDQVYQPTEEEIRSFVDPYENLICTECHEGGDDGLMLLCDICDSPSHTYCVGLGWQVPEGNWYCDGCKLVALGSSSTPARDPSSDHRTTDNTADDRAPSLTNLGESSGPMIESSPCLAFSQENGNLPSPRFLTADGPTASPVSGSGAGTLSIRRQIHRHIQNMISSRMVYSSGRPDVISAASLHSELINTADDRAPSLSNLGESSGPLIESSLCLAFPQENGNVPSP